MSEPARDHELLLIADDLERFAMRRTAERIRALVSKPPAVEERPFPVQDHEAGNRFLGIPWGLAEILYPAYGHDQTLERMGERGGFSRAELGALAADCYTRGRPRLRRPPLLDLYELAVSGERELRGAST